ncbi:hypothetical protein [Clostridium ljungdahlii]|uniref:Uncharacterized protein n=1 Tax=Clostridium ljungdahlii TaxID=1538 RepID=A0A170NKL0_9CLOT|nr:hypothetical protein [Clostridium ljungdahlii]OAA91243.1 hypothetical protein WY13_00808 [Clostridium ljungdahlii]
MHEMICIGIIVAVSLVGIISFKKFKNNKILLIVLFYGLGTILFADILKFVYNGQSYSDWYNFLGGFVGGAIGGIATLIAIVISTSETRKIQKQNESNMQNRYKMDNIKANKPLLMLKEMDNGTGYAPGCRLYIAQFYVNDPNIIICEMVNVGVGVAKNIDISISLLDRNQAFVHCTNLLIKGKSITNIRLECERNKQIDYSKPLEIKYEDIFGNLYSTLYEIESFDLENKSLKYIRNKNITLIEPTKTIQ